jgi:hypothetical protein
VQSTSSDWRGWSCLRRDSESQYGCPDEGAGSGVLLANISGDFFCCPTVHDSAFVVGDVVYETFEFIRSTNAFFLVDMSGRCSSFSVLLSAGPLAVSIASSMDIWDETLFAWDKECAAGNPKVLSAF